ncbi:MAG: signal peptidase I [Eubacterium sp.]|nr:signal peptidase I [Eubacterium sp.]
MENKRILEKYNAYKLGWLHDSLHFVILIAAAFILFRFVIGLAVVGGDSMEPALQDGTVVLYLRTVRNFQPGDIISMRVPSGAYYVKRVAAVGKDTVDLQDGHVLVNGETVDDPWAQGETDEETGAVIYPYYVREGNVFVLGDNRVVSMDSRAFGEVSRRQIKGKLLLRFGKDGIHRVR